MGLKASIKRLEQKLATQKSRGRGFWCTINPDGTFKDDLGNIYETEEAFLKGVGYQEGDMVWRFMIPSDAK
jgi:hypothetical protein